MSAQVVRLPIGSDEIIRRAQSGDAGAFDRLYDEHVGRIHALCLRMSGDRVEAERLTQDVFVRVWQQLPSFRGESAFSSWLHRLAINVVLQDRRSDERRTVRIESVDDLTTVRENRTERADHELRLDLERAIAALPYGARVVLVLHDIEGYRHEEIAELCGIAVGTAKAQLHRARRLLRESLAP